MRMRNPYLSPVMMMATLLFLTVNAHAQGVLEAPHLNVTSPSISGCLDCHDLTAVGWPKFIPEPYPGYVARDPAVLENENTSFNLKCWECHHSGTTVIAGGSAVTLDYMATHSSLSTGSTKYGEWAVGCTVCHNAHSQGGQPGGKFIWNFARLDQIEVYGAKPPKSGKKTMVFNGPTGPNSFADGDATYDGICEVCHTETAYHRNNAGGDHAHYAGRHCTNCHSHTSGFKPGVVCLDCHSNAVNARAAVGTQFSGNSHHIQGVALSSEQCYQCHWEADINGEPTPYHTPEISGSAVDLVIRDNNNDGIADSRPGIYTLGATAIQYTAGASTALELNPHCLGCHNDDYNNYTTGGGIFGDGKAPNQYAWDGTSVATRYSQTGTTPWGKYSGPNVTPKNTQVKAFSAHGNALSNQGGWDLNETWPNSRNGAVNIACFDCHNAHGSTAEGTTTSYASATTNGGLLKDTVSGKGGYGVDYKPAPGGSAENKNLRASGASLCLDCHLSADGAAEDKPWGYQSTFGAGQQILGYFDSPFLAPGIAGSQLRYPYKGMMQNAGGHFGASSPLASTPLHQINGLCTPCHDPHGVSPSLGADQQYSVPLLKGTWITSPYKEDAAPANNATGTVRDGTYPLGIDGTPREGVPYHIDQNTFGANIRATTTGVSQTDAQFAGLCLQCHPKNSLTDGANGGPWKSIDRIHEAVKGWGANARHNYTCSKCHAPHNGSVLPRLMVTNCLNAPHKGRVGYTPSPVLSGSGYCTENNCYGEARTHGFGWFEEIEGGSGGGNFPGSWSGFYPGSYTVSCHENMAADQSWNSVTPWTSTTPSITSGPAVTLQGQIVLLHMDENSWSGTPGEVRDDSGMNHHGTAFNGANTLPDGISGNAANFDGANDYVKLTYSPPVDNFTLEAWIKPTTTHEIDAESTTGAAGRLRQRYLFGADSRGTDGGAGVSAGTNGISVYENSTGYYMPALAVYSGTISADEWTHLVVVYTDKRPSIYLNGLLVHTGLQSPRPHVYAPTMIGGGPYGFFSGAVDDVAMYDRSLSPEEILLHYQFNSSSACSDSEATITWSTNQAMTSHVDYGETAAYGLTAADDALVANHAVTLSGLASPATYHFRIRSFNGEEEIVSGDYTFDMRKCPDTPPLLDAPTATEMGSTTAILGANIVTDGGFGVTERGTVWGTMTNPSGNIASEGGTVIGPFSHVRTNLPSGTKIFYRGYAANSGGTRYSPVGSFYTEPTTQASGVTFSDVSNTGMTVSWTRGNGDGVIVLMKQLASIDATPVDGIFTAYAAGTEFGTGAHIGSGSFVVYKGTGTTVSVTGLSPDTHYHVAAFEYIGESDSSGFDQGVNYTSAPATGNTITGIIPGTYSYTFDYTGAMRQLNIPSGATNIQFTVKGAGGGGGRRDTVNNQTNGQPGHFVTMPYDLSGVALDIYVGHGGREGAASYPGAPGGWGYVPGDNGGDGGQWNSFNNCRPGYGGAGGGGSSAITLEGTTLLTQAAGGAGGKSSTWDDGDNCYELGGAGGAGGGADYPEVMDPAGGGGGGIAGDDPAPGGDGQVTVSYQW